MTRISFEPRVLTNEIGRAEIAKEMERKSERVSERERERESERERARERESNKLNAAYHQSIHSRQKQ